MSACENVLASKSASELPHPIYQGEKNWHMDIKIFFIQPWHYFTKDKADHGN